MKILGVFLSLSLALVCIFLGIWQLDKSQEVKKAQRNSQNSLLQALHFGEFLKNPQTYEKIQVSGYFIKDAVVFVDEILQEQRRGYLILQVFREDAGNNLLIMRGWKPYKAGADFSHSVSALTSPREFEFVIKPEKNFPNRFQMMATKANQFPISTTNLDFDLIAELLGEPVYKTVFSLESQLFADEVAFTPAKLEASEAYGKHLSYAIQWFIFSLFSLALAYVLYTKKN